jgi:hypothetical protein
LVRGLRFGSKDVRDEQKKNGVRFDVGKSRHCEETLCAVPGIFTSKPEPGVVVLRSCVREQPIWVGIGRPKLQRPWADPVRVIECLLGLLGRVAPECPKERQGFAGICWDLLPQASLAASGPRTERRET